MDVSTSAELLADLLRESVAVDLSPTLRPGMPTMSVHPDLGIVRDARTHDRHGYFGQSLVMFEHVGAHVDAPIHVHGHMTDATVDRLEVDSLIGTFKKYDLGRLDPQPGQLLTRAQLRAEEERAGFEPASGDVVLLDFGWSAHFKPEDPDWAVRRWWADNNAGLAEDACDHLAGAGVKAVCSDTVACDIAVVDGEITSDFGHATYFLPNGILIVEGLARLGELPPTGGFLALPLKIDGGSGSPLRPIALCDRA